MDSTFIVRPRSALGLKYVELTPGPSTGRLRRRAPRSRSRQATPEPVEIDEVFNIFDARTRRGAQQSLNGFGTGFAGRGRDLNEAIEELHPLLDDLEPVAANLADPRHAARPLLPRARRRRRRGGAGGRGAGGAVRATWTPPSPRWPASRGRSSRSSSPRARRRSTRRSREFPQAAPVPAQQRRASSASCGPGVRTLPASAPVLADALEFGTRTLPKTPRAQPPAGRRVRLAGRVRRGPAGAARHRAPARHGPLAAARRSPSSRPPRPRATT